MFPRYYDRPTNFSVKYNIRIVELINDYEW